MAKIHILVGSVTGKAFSAAEAIHGVFSCNEHVSQVHFNPSIDQICDESADLIVIVTSTCGQGDLPHNIRPLHTELQNASTPIAINKFAVVALGDSSYQTFCQAGIKMEAQMLELQWQRLCERFNIDASEHFIPVDEARQWALNCLALL
jgi:MioC protein